MLRSTPSCRTFDIQIRVYIVDFDTDWCIGYKACMQGCPYDAPYIDLETSTAAKSNYCSHRVDSGHEPACVTVCPEDAIIAGDMEN